MRYKAFLVLILMFLTACSSGNNRVVSTPPPAPTVTVEPTPDSGSQPEPEPTKEDAAIVFILADSQPDDSSAVLGSLNFAELISERTDGEWEVEVYSGGALGDEASVVDKILSGDIDFARLDIDTLYSISPETAAGLVGFCWFDCGPVVISADIWNGYSPEDQSLIKQCALEAALYERGLECAQAVDISEYEAYENFADVIMAINAAQ